MFHLEVAVESCAEHHTALGNGGIGEHAEDAARRRLHPHRLVWVDGGVGGEWSARLGLVEHGADALAQVALDAQRGVDGGVAEALLVLVETDAVLWASLHARRASAAVVLIAYFNHIPNLLITVNSFLVNLFRFRKNISSCLNEIFMPFFRSSSFILLADEVSLYWIAKSYSINL